MANIASTVIFSDIKEREDIPDDSREVVEEIIRRLDIAFGQILSGIRAEPTIFTVDPTDPDNAELVEGAKPGDVAIWRDSDGETQTYVFS